LERGMKGRRNGREGYKRVPTSKREEGRENIGKGRKGRGEKRKGKDEK